MLIDSEMIKTRIRDRRKEDEALSKYDDDLWDNGHHYGYWDACTEILEWIDMLETEEEADGKEV